ncbi:hypothetical protein Kpol_1053p13 [Vanderwaltozyma polyspora DSM 70294]|uniref:PCI domain-containing protein n=1 Tax=Vanderwaltozyma polyspora (strain ATCC 22028 / DSM 70294 / BCRC 21397 / CBS 2163 / NBRC 10782 / NRRL Y-8283 / UCD 57-17) TaxID=436907 RepID=A7TN59_VANPO|nr:uncharacterized protein Kpol_1053p13 [Vanderwaltozyma polyspora DSM 70294]EDO16277.1 hypothetical protein Kpol_1053p13 [Vanderwaltozyma polyspora DSM 70294]
MSYNLSSFFNDLSNGLFINLSLDLAVNGRIVSQLQSELQNYSNGNAINDKSLESLVESQSFQFYKSGKSEWTRFNIMVVSFLRYCRDVNPWSLSESYDLIFQFYSDLNNCLLNDNYPIDPLVPIYQAATEYIIPVASKLDDHYMVLHTRKHQFLSHCSSIISKLFNSIKPSRSIDGETIMSEPSFDQLPGKQKILLYLVNKLNNIYFKIGSPQLCSNIFKNFKPKSMVTIFSEFPVKEQVEYRYLLGRYYILNNKIVDAFIQLNNAFLMLSSVADVLNIKIENSSPLKRNINRILKYLVPVGLMMNKLPKFWIVSKIDVNLANKYKELSDCVRTGNIKGLNGWLKLYEAELRKDHLLLILIEKLPMLTYRYLIRKVVLEYTMPLSGFKVPVFSIRIGIKIIYR